MGHASAQVSEWTGNGATNSFLDAANWSAGVPAGPSATALIPFGGPDLQGVASVGAIEITGGGLELSFGSTLEITGPAATNNALIRINADNSSFNSILSFPNTTTLNGTGVLEMLTANDNSQLAGAGLLINGPSHTIRGTGQVNVAWINQGVIDAAEGNGTQRDLEIRAGGENQGTMSATLNTFDGMLQIIGAPIIQTGSGRLFANGGQIEIFEGSSVMGGTLETTNGGSIDTTAASGNVTFADVTNQGDLFIDFGTIVDVMGSGLTNNALIVLNNQNSSANAALNFAQTGLLGGSGELRMRTNFDNSQINSSPSVTLSHGSDHTIRGVGQINAAMNNAGTVAADLAVALSASPLELQTNNKVNSGLFEARSASELAIDGIAVDQSGGGMIAATDGRVTFAGPSTVHGGDISSSGSGSVSILTGSTTTFDDVASSASLFIDANGTLNLDTGLINNGTIAINEQNSSFNATLTTDEQISILGNGSIILRTGGANSFITTTGSGELTLGSGQTLVGTGEVNGQIVNNGIIAADAASALSGLALELDIGPFTNNGMMIAEAASELQFQDVLVTQDAPASIEAMGGLVTLGAGARIEQGELVSADAGLFRTFGGGDRELSGVTLNGTVQVDAGTTLTVDNAGLVNNGLIEVNRNNSSFNSNLDLSDATISGTGEIQLRTGGNNSFVRTKPGTTGQIGVGQLVRGVGEIQGELINDGMIAADVAVSLSGIELVLNTNNKTNNSQLRAEGGSVLSTTGVTIDQSSGGSMLAADGGTVELNSGSAIIGGTLGSNPGGKWSVLGGRSDIDAVALNGTGEVKLGTTLGILDGALQNDAAITINPDNSSFDAVLLIAQDTQITGAGSMDFFTEGFGNSAVRPETGLDPLPVLTNGPDHTLSGFATIEVPLVNEGTIRVGRPIRDFIARDSVALTSGGTMEVSIGGNGQNGQLELSGADASASIAGSLDLQLLAGETLTNGFNHVIVDGPYTGEFENIALLTDGPLVTRIRYETDEIVVRTRCRADVNLDGLLSPADFTAWIAAFNTRDSVADQNLDGLVSPADFSSWIQNFNTPCP
ncbi:MAG: GC-type dockerin domain-anchored protein [Planctomycetota bacterium]